MNFFIFGKPQDRGLRVTFFMTGGQSVVTTGVDTIKTTKNGDGGFDSYSITWHEGQKPAFFSLVLSHIVAITAEKM